jgi:hypothetical protein
MLSAIRAGDCLRSWTRAAGSHLEALVLSFFSRRGRCCRCPFDDPAQAPMTPCGIASS